MILMAFATGCLWLGWMWTVVSIDPYTTTIVGFLLFYLTFFLSLVGTFTLLGVWFRKKRLEQAYFFHLVMLSARQGIFLSSIFIILLLFQSTRWLDLWTMAIILAAAFGFELFFLRQNRRGIKFDTEVVEPDPLENLLTDTVPPVFEKRVIE